LNYENSCNIVAAMTAGSAPSKSPTPEEFGRLLCWLSPDLETATRMFLEITKKLRQWFVWKGSTHAEDLVDETVDRVAKIVSRESDRYHSQIGLFYGVARNVWREDIRKLQPFEDVDPDKTSVPHPEDWDFKECEEDCMKECMDHLPERERHLMIQYHRFKGQEKIMARKRLAEEHGGLGNLRTIICRIRIRLYGGLEDCIGECMNRRQSTEMR